METQLFMSVFMHTAVLFVLFPNLLLTQNFVFEKVGDSDPPLDLWRPDLLHRSDLKIKLSCSVLCTQVWKISAEGDPAAPLDIFQCLKTLTVGFLNYYYD